MIILLCIYNMMMLPSSRVSCSEPGVGSSLENGFSWTAVSEASFTSFTYRPTV